MATYRELTDRKQRECEIQRLASFPQLNPNPILEVDTSGRITYPDQVAREIVAGLGPPAKLRDLLPADLKQILLAIKQTGETHFQREVQVKDRGLSPEHLLRRAIADHSPLRHRHHGPQTRGDPRRSRPRRSGSAPLRRCRT